MLNWVEHEKSFITSGQGCHNFNFSLKNKEKKKKKKKKKKNGDTPIFLIKEIRRENTFFLIRNSLSGKAEIM